MKTKLKCMVIILVALIFTITGTIYAAGSFSVSAGKTSLNPGGAATITISTSNCAGKFTVTSSNSSVVTVSSGSIFVDGTSTITATAKAAGTATITVTPVDVSDTDLNDVTGSKSVTIKVTTPAASNNTSNSTTNNKTNSNTSTNTNKNNNTNTNTNKGTTTTTKSSNAYLKSMILSIEGLSPAFSKNITSYSLNVGENVSEIKVNASVENSRASYSVSGNTNLKEGENVVTVKVTAEDGTVKTYTINVLKSDDPIKSDATLESLIIEDVNLGQTFDTNITEYNAGDITVKDSKLNVYAYTSSENATVEIIGNENLGVGEGKITIRVTSENGKVTKDYVVSFNKLYSEDNVEIYSDALRNVESDNSWFATLKNSLKENATIIILYFFVWIEFIQIVYLYEKLKKYEDLDKITVGKRIEKDKNELKKEKPRRVKENPIFPDEEEKK